MKFASLLLFLWAAPVVAQAPSAHLDGAGKLVYKATPRGDHIVDFSYAGYMGGGVALPANVPAVETLYPSGQDDTKALQAALDKAAERAAAEHKLVALSLAAGTFHLSETVHLRGGSVVLRGAGAKKTALMLTATPHLGLHIGPGQTAADDEGGGAQAPLTAAPAGASTTLAEAYVPSGSITIPVTSSQGFAAGDTVQIDCAFNDAYLKFMGMYGMVRDGKPERWVGSHIVVERRIASIDGNTLTLDVPLTDSYDPKFGGGSDTKVTKIAPPRRIAQVGVEALTIAAPPLSINLSDPHYNGLQIAATEDAWLRDVYFLDVTSAVEVTASSRRITIDSVDVLDHLPVRSPAKPFAISLAGTQTLVMRSTVKADKNFFAATQAREQGPNVVLHCTFIGDQSLEPHQRWGTGFLVDNVTVQGGAINFINRGIMGSGHGWTMGWGVVWNSSADTVTVQAPPGAVNWAIGVQGKRIGKPMPVEGKKGPDLPEGTFESYGKRVAPDSLYLEQLKERLGPQAVKNIGY